MRRPTPTFIDARTTVRRREDLVPLTREHALKDQTGLSSVVNDQHTHRPTVREICVSAHVHITLFPHFRCFYVRISRPVAGSASRIDV